MAIRTTRATAHKKTLTSRRPPLPRDNDRNELKEFFSGLRQSVEELREILSRCRGEWGEDDGVYRFYTRSFNVYSLQALTEEIVAALRSVAPRRRLNRSFARIIRDGTGNKYRVDQSRPSFDATRAIVEALFHANYFARLAVRYGTRLEPPPRPLPRGWAALLCLYGLKLAPTRGHR